MPLESKPGSVMEYLQGAQIRKQQECEEAKYCVCGETSYFGDDVEASCAECGRKIFHRPHAPKSPAKICLPCMELNVKLTGESVEAIISQAVAYEIGERLR